MTADYSGDADHLRCRDVARQSGVLRRPSVSRSPAMRFVCWKLDLLALAGTLPRDRLSLAVNTEPIAHALIEESRCSTRADETSRTRFVHAKTQVSRATRWHRRCT